MPDPDKPPLSQYVWEEIEVAVHELDKQYYEQLRGMLVLVNLGIYSLLNPPPPPKQPAHVRAILHSYVRALFQTEASKYPSDPQLKHWLEKLAERTREHVLHAVAEVETGSIFKRLDHHGVTMSEMRDTVDEALRQSAQEYLQTSAAPQQITEAESKRKLSGKLADTVPHAPAPEPPKTQAAPKPSRKEVVIPLLEAKGWSVLDWANEAGVAYHTASDYLSGSKNPFRSTRVKLAKALGISVNQLPH